jgi:hypothetical protein
MVAAEVVATLLVEMGIAALAVDADSPKVVVENNLLNTP